MPPVITSRSGGILLPLLISLAVPSSCSVLEDRDDCPCRLRVEVRKRCRLTPEREVQLCLRSDMTPISREETRPLAEWQDLQFEMQIPKGTIRADGYVGLQHCERVNGCLMIPYGQPTDSLYWVSGTARAVGETAVLPLRIRKEYCRLSLEFLYDEEGPYPYSTTIRSTTAGLLLTDGTPVAGPFLCTPDETSPGHFETLLPRQLTPDDLILEIRDKGATAPPLTEIPLGRLISSSGAFSWEDEDLKDLLLRFDYAHAELTLQVMDWELGQVFTYII